jgi:hypothetical protein
VFTNTWLGTIQRNTIRVGDALGVAISFIANTTGSKSCMDNKKMYKNPIESEETSS